MYHTSLCYYPQIIVNGFWKYVDIISAKGISYEDWPYDMDDNRFYSSPIIYDINEDGKEEIISADDNGVIRIVEVGFCISIVNLQLNEDHTPKTLSTIDIPPIHINRRWFENVVEVTSVEECKKIVAVPDTSDLIIVRHCF